MTRRPIIRKYLTPILMEQIAWNLINKLSVKDISRLNGVSTDRVYKILRSAEFQGVMGDVKKRAFAKVEQDTQDRVGLAVEKMQHAAPDIVDMLIELADNADVSPAVRHAAGLTILTKGGTQAAASGGNQEQVIDAKTIEAIRTVEKEISGSKYDRSVISVPN